MTKAQQRRVPFEQVFLEQAFTYSTMDSVENVDKMLRALKGLLVQKHTREILEDKEVNADVYLEQLAVWERQPLEGIDKDVYSICEWLRNGVDEIVLWRDGRPVNRIKLRKVRGGLRLLLDELNTMAGELCDVMDIKPFALTSKKFTWFQRGGVKDVA